MNKKKPLISIYSTVFNTAYAVGKSLDSIIKQFPDFVRNFELIITDNNSTDGTYEILKAYQRRYRNIKIFQEKCSRGRGRLLSYLNSTGNFTISVDLDQTYNINFSKFVRKAARIYKSGSLFGTFCDRATIDRIGNWNDLLGGDDTEFQARAIHRGVKVYLLPFDMFRNFSYSGVREKRYSKSRIGSFVRIIKNFESRIAAQGIHNIHDISSRTISGELLTKAIYIKMKLFHDKIYNYSDFRTNEELIYHSAGIADPKLFKISKKYWVYVIPTRAISTYVMNICLSKYYNLGFDRVRFITPRHILIYTKETSKKIIDYYEDFYTKFLEK